MKLTPAGVRDRGGGGGGWLSHSRVEWWVQRYRHHAEGYWGRRVKVEIYTAERYSPHEMK